MRFDSIVDGVGLRCVIWTQGCRHHCEGCHNPQTHDVNAGNEVDTQELIECIKNSKLQQGITLSGGEPFLQSEALLEVVTAIKPEGFDVWAYSGFRFEELLQNSQQKALLKEVDVLVDGKFEAEYKQYGLRFRGSSNQRIIDVQKSLKQHKIIELDEKNI